MRIDRAAGRVARVTIRSTRPLATARVVVGRRAGEAATLLPRLYSICANAQGAASASALAAACGRPPSPSQLAARAFAVALENLQEDLRRLLIDIPRALGESPQVVPVATARRSFAPLLAAMLGAAGADAVPPDARRHATEAAVDAVADHVLGEPLSRFARRRDADALERWARETPTAPARVLRAVLDRGGRLGASDVPTLPPMSRECVETTLLPALSADAAFPAAPRVDGTPHETGALARMATHPAIAAFVSRRGRGIASRLAARVGDVARTTAALADGTAPVRIDAWATRDGAGVALVETARGLLLHRAEVRDDAVTGYAIVAPTEWNFQPGGPLERSVAGLDAADAQALHRDAALVVQSLDPCVACGIEVRDA